MGVRHVTQKDEAETSRREVSREGERAERTERTGRGTETDGVTAALSDDGSYDAW